MKIRIYLLLLSVMLAGNLSGFGIGGDVAEPQPFDSVPQELSPRMRALRSYTAGLLEKDLKKRTDLLLEAVELDPSAKLPLAILVKTAVRVPDRLFAVQKKLKSLRSRRPMDLFWVLKCCEMDSAAGIRADEILAYIEPVLRTKPGKKDSVYFYDLAGKYVDLLLNSGSRTRLLAFAADDIRLQEMALVYYSITSGRDQLLMRSSPAFSEVKKYSALLTDLPFDKVVDLHRHLQMLNAAGMHQMAFRTAGKFYRKTPGVLAAHLYASAAADAGERKELEAVFAKYRRFPADFYARMRFQCLIRRGEFESAFEQSANFRSPEERISRRLSAAQMKRDAAAVKKLLAQMSSSAKFNPLAVGLGYIHLAEFTGDKKMIGTGRKILDKYLWNTPVIANSVGYVQAVLGVDLAESERLLTFALSREPRSFAYLDSMAWIKYKQKKYPEALKYIEKAMSFAGHSGKAVLADHAGDIHLALGNRQKAVNYFKLALSLFEKNKNENADLDSAALKKKIRTWKNDR